MMFSRSKKLVPALIGMLAILGLLIFPSKGHAQNPDPGIVKKENCLECHSEEGLVKREGDNLFKAITINPERFEASVHGSLDCTACHSNFEMGIHGILRLDDETELRFLKMFREKSKSSHQALYSCSRCHPTEYDEYMDSVHGKALMEEGIGDVPYCTDCHGKHYIKFAEDESSAIHPANVPLVCAKCHEDEALVLRYNLDDSAVSGYYESYHGKKYELGHQKVPVCTDCHTAHSIKEPDDPSSSVYGDSGEKTCGSCHPGADASFINAFTHKPPTLESAPIVYIVRWIYSWILTIVILGMAFYIGLDMIAQIRLRIRARKGGGGH